MVGRCNVANSDACMCRNLVCFIVFLVIGLVLLIAGGVIAAIGFGTWPIDNFDYANLGKRVAGLILAVAGVLPIVIAVCCLLFYIAYKKGKLPDEDKMRDPTALVPMKSAAWGQEKSQLGDAVSYLPEGKPGIYSLQTNDDSMYRSSGANGGGQDDSFASVPLSVSYNPVTSAPNDRYPLPSYNDSRYPDGKRPPSKKSMADEDMSPAAGVLCENQVDSIDKDHSSTSKSDYSSEDNVAVGYRTKHTTRVAEEQHRGQDDEYYDDNNEHAKPKNKKKSKKRKEAVDTYDEGEYTPARYGNISSEVDVEFSPEEELAPPSAYSKQHRKH